MKEEQFKKLMSELTYENWKESLLEDALTPNQQTSVVHTLHRITTQLMEEFGAK